MMLLENAQGSTLFFLRKIINLCSKRKRGNNIGDGFLNSKMASDHPEWKNYSTHLGTVSTKLKDQISNYYLPNFI